MKHITQRLAADICQDTVVRDEEHAKGVLGSTRAKITGGNEKRVPHPRLACVQYSGVDEGRGTVILFCEIISSFGDSKWENGCCYPVQLQTSTPPSRDVFSPADFSSILMGWQAHYTPQAMGTRDTVDTQNRVN